MLSIRTQDRMNFVQYKNYIGITEEMKKDVSKQIMELHFETTTMENLNKISKLQKNEDSYEYQIVCNDRILGVYATKERAIEVLDEIESVYERTTQAFVNEKNDITVHEYNVVYQMPNE